MQNKLLENRRSNFVAAPVFVYNGNMFYIVGLGNPGEKYRNTRHNIGWLVLDYVREQASLPTLVHEKQNSAQVTGGILAGEEVTIVYPDTFMNNSGAAVVKFVKKAETEKLIVLHDDIDLPFGQIKIGRGRGDGGNNGIKSIIQKLGTKDFVRIRIGIAPTSFWSGKTKRPAGGGPLERFVLKPFSTKEAKQLEEVAEKSYQALQEILKNGPEIAMNKFN